jgi:hypothetical protein
MGFPVCSVFASPLANFAGKEEDRRIMVKVTVTILFALLCLVSTISFAQDRHPVQDPPLITFADLNRSDLDDGPFRIEGVVTDIYKCPPCPRGAQCKPCIGDHLTISDNPDEKDPALKHWLRIFAKPSELEKYEVATKYSFLVKVRGKLRIGKPVEDVDLIDPLETNSKP